MDPALEQDGDGTSSILLLGDRRLRRKSLPVRDFSDPNLKAQQAHLLSVLESFRRKHGFGRAIAAPQIGLPLQIIALSLGPRRECIHNPRIVERSEKTFTMWDDCMSFPDLLVRLARHASVVVEYQDERGEPRVWDRMSPATSELLQHEIDHLQGILAVDRALDHESLVARAAFEANPIVFRAMVDGPQG